MLIPGQKINLISGYNRDCFETIFTEKVDSVNGVSLMINKVF